MTRTRGAKNRTPRELDNAAKHLKDKARLLKRIEKLKKAPKNK